MGNNNIYTNQNFGTFLFLILFLLFVLAFSGNPGNHSSSSAKYPSQSELVPVPDSNHRNAILSIPVSLPYPQKYCEFTLLNKSLIPFSVRNKISDYNRKIAQKIIRIQKADLEIEPAPLCRLYYLLSSKDDDSLPFLS